MKRMITAIGVVSQIASSQAVQGQLTGPDPEQTARLEKKIVEDLTSMIHQYDFTSVFHEAVTEEQARQIAWQKEYKPTVQELLKKLQETLQDEAQIEQMWPDARLKDKEMFSHLNLEFDLLGKKITAETAAKDYHGVPIYQYIYDTAEKTATEITNTEAGLTSEVIEVPAIGQVVEKQEPAAIVVAPTAPIAPTAAPVAKNEPQSKAQEDDVENVVPLTLEEQREVAFKVVGFFIMLICASFIILYIYHKMSEASKSKDEKKTFCEFLAGQVDDTYPPQQHTNNVLTNVRFPISV